uniref:Exocyst subunit Exo70 family protein n=2 Tax=Cajanus cajan TaxID=3821 RepID=A0A151U0S0_CAJCA|nr:Exocyst complex component 7 [Cajanus cajan]
MISKHVDTCLKVNIVDTDLIPVPQRDDNLVLDALQFGDDDNTFDDLRETAKLMVMAGFQEECCAAYCSWRREFLNETLSTFGLQVQDIHKKDKAQCLIKALIVAVRILFPYERRLCDRVFGMSNISSDFAFTDVCTELATSLLSTVDTLADLIPHALEELMYEFETLFFGKYSKSLKIDARKVRKSLGILMDSENVLTYCGHGLLPVTLQLSNYIRDNSIQTASDLKQDSDGMLSPSMQLVMLTRLFERSLKVNSKNCNNPTSGYVFILNNRSYIHRDAYMHQQTSNFYFWLRKNKTKIEKYLQLYRKSSWTKILNILKLDMDESEPNAAAELMKDKLRSFNEHFYDICNDQSTWFVLDKLLRKRMINSIESILLPAYGNFIGRLQDFLGNHAYEFIKYGIIDIQDRLNNLFLVTE